MLYGAYYKMRVHLSIPCDTTANVGNYWPHILSRFEDEATLSSVVYLNKHIYLSIEYQSYFGSYD